MDVLDDSTTIIVSTGAVEVNWLLIIAEILTGIAVTAVITT